MPAATPPVCGPADELLRQIRGMSTRRVSKFPAYPASDCLSQLPEIERAVARVMRGGQFILGHEVRAFEEDFSNYLGVEETVAVGTGTDAIELMLRALDLGQGDAVVIPTFAPSAVAAGVERAGCTVVLADVEPESLTLCPDALDEILSSDRGRQVRAALAVHLFGHPADWERLSAVAQKHGIELLEDAAQSHGTRWRNRLTGSLGRMAAFSFYPTKNLGALGDAGAVTTSDPDLAERLRELRQYGWRRRYISDQRGGINSRMDELQAAILRAKLPLLEAQVSRRRALAAVYQEWLPSGIHLPGTQPGASHSWHQFVVRLADRDALKEHLERAGIPVAVLYPACLHEQGAWAGSNTFSNAEKAARQVLALPLHPHLSPEAVMSVAEQIREYLHVAS